MLKNSVYAKSLISLVSLLILFTCLTAESESATLDEFKYSLVVLNSVKSEIKTEMDTLGQYFTIRTGIVNMLAENNEDIRDNALTSTSL